MEAEKQVKNTSKFTIIICSSYKLRFLLNREAGHIKMNFGRSHSSKKSFDEYGASENERM